MTLNRTGRRILNTTLAILAAIVAGYTAALLVFLTAALVTLPTAIVTLSTVHPTATSLFTVLVTAGMVISAFTVLVIRATTTKNRTR